MTLKMYGKDLWEATLLTARDVLNDLKDNYKKLSDATNYILAYHVVELSLKAVYYKHKPISSPIKKHDIKSLISLIKNIGITIPGEIDKIENVFKEELFYAARYPDATTSICQAYQIPSTAIRIKCDISEVIKMAERTFKWAWNMCKS